MRSDTLNKEFIKKLETEIINNQSLEGKEIKFVRFQLYKKSNLLKVVVKANESLNKEEEEVIKKIFIKNLKLDIEIQILCYKDVIGISSEEVVNRYWMEVVGDIVRKNPLAKEVLASKYKKVIDNKVVISYGSEALVNHLKNKGIEEQIMRIYLKRKSKTLRNLSIKNKATKGNLRGEIPSMVEILV